MTADIKIEITGITNAIKNYTAFRKELQDMSEPLTLSVQKYLNVVHTNFTDNGATFGQIWPPLKDSTITIKRQLRKEGKSIGVEKPLLRTGALRKSFGYTLKNKTTAYLFNAMSYAMIHQTSGASTYKGRATVIPKRVLAAVDTARVEMVARVFTDWTTRLINKHIK